MSYTLEERFHTSGLPLTPYSTFFDGVCMLADISGFTRLSGTFCERGKDGIDQLQLVVNGYLGQLVKIVYAYGGDVMKFAGDALVCVFLPSRLASIGVGRTLSLADVCSNAIQCATEVAEQCTDSLTVHVAISCGSICFAMLGGTDAPTLLIPHSYTYLLICILTMEMWSPCFVRYNPGIYYMLSTTTNHFCPTRHCGFLFPSASNPSPTFMMASNLILP